ncbi:LytTR family two component transcriptional regulator [Maribacter vaceletii]|uniref:LytTR family two component transcriptional regulator n=1 Tax=Maribacter vaceletii TaxID=1206816 RepID=A0A495EBW4_9FLAO|nr:LytTR family DNA-binding domain-containing protein [Maribacter vaceletii]RKR14191.1 LytTR family two component transcriptional regulator [Maribacter vaceletii]
MKCIIVDDEATARAVVAKFCEDSPEISVEEDFSNAIDAIKFLNKQEVDVVFLDIHMPGFTGFDFVETLKKPPKIVLITSDKDLALQAYEYEAIVDYLVKPLTKERFIKCVTKVKTAIQNQAIIESASSANNSLGLGELYINIDHRLIKLKFNEILVIQALGDYINIKTENTEYKVHNTLKKIKEKLPTDIFLQIHRSYIINFTKIIDIEDNSVLIDKNVIPISRSNKPKLMQHLNLLK